MLPQQGIMSLANYGPQADRAVDQVLSSTTQMLGKLDNKTLGLLLQLTQYLKDHKSKYKELIGKLEKKGSLPPGVFPDHYDPKFLSVFALSVSKAQKGGMAEGGIATIAQTLKNQGRGKDTMLAHISPSEARLLEKRGGVGTINPATGLPEYGLFEDIGNALSGVGNAVGNILKPVGDLIGNVVSSPLGLAATAAAAYYFMGPSAGAVVPSVAGATLPGEAAAIGTAAHLTPAAIESGIGSAGYGTSAAAAESGLFNPETIGSGAAIGAPSTTDKLLSANLLKNVKLSSGEEEPASDPNALIKLLMMFEMMNSKQNQPVSQVLPALTENTSSLPYDKPKKDLSSFIPSQTTHAAGGGLMTKHLGIGGLSAKRSQTDYAKNYLPGSGYRPGQGGITYFTPVEYIGDGTTAPTDTTGTSPSTATDELLRQTLGRTGGGGGMDSESRAAMLAETAARMDAWEKADPEGYKHRNDWIKNLFNGSMLVQLAKLASQGIDTVKQTWANERLKALGIDPKIVLANQNAIAGTSMQQALNSLGQASAAAGNYAEVGGYEPGSEEAKAAASGTVGGYGPGTPGFNAMPDTSNPASVGMVGLPPSNYTPTAYTFQPNAVNNLLSNLGLPESNETVERYLAENKDIALAKTTDDVLKQLIADSNLAASASSAADIPTTIREATTPEAQANKIAELTNIAKTNEANADERAEYEKRAQMLADQTNEESLASALGSDYTPRGEEGQAAVAKLAQRIEDQEKARLDRLAASIAADPVRAAREARLKMLLGQTNEESIKSFLGDDYTPKEIAPVESESDRLDQLIQSFLDTTPGDVFGPAVQLAAADGFNLGEPSGNTIGNYSMFVPQEAADTSGVLSANAIQQAYPGAFDQSPLASLAPTSYSYLGGQGNNSILGGYGGLGSAWQGVVDSSGNPVLTSQGAAERAFLNSPEGIALGNERALQGYISPLSDPAQRQGQGSETQGNDGNDGNDGGADSGGYAASAQNAGTARGDSDGGGGYSNANAGNYGWARSGGGEGGGWAAGGTTHGGIANLHQYNLGSYSDGGRLLKGPGDGVSDSIPATIGQGQPARLADGEFVIPARIVSELGNGSTDAGAKRLYEMMDRIQRVRRKTKNVAANTKAAKYLPA